MYPTCISIRARRALSCECENATYHGDDLSLDGLVQGNQAKVEGEVKLSALLASHSPFILRSTVCPARSSFGGLHW